MWTANAATCAPSADARDARLHLAPANLTAMFHRSLEAATTTRVLRAIFADAARFEVHEPLPGASHFADEGAANHTRLFVEGRPAVHLFAWGRRAFDGPPRGEPVRFPARQTLESSRALARLLRLAPAQALFPQQDPRGSTRARSTPTCWRSGTARLLHAARAAFVELRGSARPARTARRALAVELAGEDELPAASAVGPIRSTRSS